MYFQKQHMKNIEAGCISHFLFLIIIILKDITTIAHASGRMPAYHCLQCLEGVCALLPTISLETFRCPPPYA